MQSHGSINTFAGNQGFSVVNLLSTLSLAGAATAAAVVVPSMDSQHHTIGTASTMVQVLGDLQEAYNNWAYLGGSITGSSTQINALDETTRATEAAALFVQLITSPQSHRAMGAFTDGIMTAVDSSGSCNSTTVMLDGTHVVYDEHSEDSRLLSELNAVGQRTGNEFSPNTFYVTVTHDAPSRCYYVSPAGFVEQVRLLSNGVVTFHHPKL